MKERPSRLADQVESLHEQKVQSVQHDFSIQVEKKSLGNGYFISSQQLPASVLLENGVVTLSIDWDWLAITHETSEGESKVILGEQRLPLLPLVNDLPEFRELRARMRAFMKENGPRAAKVLADTLNKSGGYDPNLQIMFSDEDFRAASESTPLLIHLRYSSEEALTTLHGGVGVKPITNEQLRQTVQDVDMSGDKIEIMCRHDVSVRRKTTTGLGARHRSFIIGYSVSAFRNNESRTFVVGQSARDARVPTREELLLFRRILLAQRLARDVNQVWTQFPSESEYPENYMLGSRQRLVPSEPRNELVEQLLTDMNNQLAARKFQDSPAHVQPTHGDARVGKHRFSVVLSDADGKRYTFKVAGVEVAGVEKDETVNTLEKFLK